MNKWVFMIKNAHSAMDPVEVIYELVKIDDDGEILERDGYLTGCEHGIWERIKEAMSNELFTKVQVNDPQFKAVPWK